MEINIQQLNSTIKLFEDDTLISPEALQGIVNAVLEAMEQREQHAERVHAEQSLEVNRHPGSYAH